jgi:hypothetical protein
MAIVRGDNHSRQLRKAVSPEASSIILSLPGQQEEVPFPVPSKFKGRNDEIYLYLARECSGGWFPSFIHGQAAARSIVNCLLDASDDRCSSLKSVSLPNPQSSDYL